ncbi:MAG: ribosome maturation factor RimM [Firmicutes bacterium]|nr:ribosome maturation factor RimM [Bacillota bacterium]
MEKILIGQIVNAVGLKGEVKVYNYSDSIEIYETTESIYVGDVIRKIEGVRRQKNMVILKLEGINDRNAAERSKGTDIYITDADLPELEEGEFYVRDLIGMSVALEDGTVIGTMTDVIQNTAQDVFEFEKVDGGKAMIPRVPEFVIDINAETRIITVRLIEGLID